MNKNPIDIRHDPEALLNAIEKKKQKNKMGKLHLFLGMSPGVGKTYAMLLAAHEAKKSDKDIVVGVVETHGRAETQKLLDGLEIIPKLQRDHRGIDLFEMDLDAILKRHPAIVLVDELAHSNIPGSRHAKRWQDVEEILKMGIDVFSTLNVQHLESRKEAVEQIAKISVQETVPDSIIDKAYQIQLIDLSVPDLLKRLKEGKVYLGDRAQHAAANFFKEEKLTALREIALRLTAEKVDTELKSFVTQREAGSTWPAVERLMVAVGFHPKSDQIIRAARKLAYNLECPWIAVHVSTNENVTPAQKAALLKNLELAHNLGADIITITDISIFDALIRVAKQNDVTKVIIGRSSYKQWIGRSLFEKLILQTNMEVCIVGDEPKTTKNPLDIFDFLKFSSPISSYLKAFFFTGILAGINGILALFVGYQSVSFFFLLGVLALGLFFPLGPVLSSALITALIWDFFFIPPIGSFYIGKAPDILMCLSYFLAAITTGILMRRIRNYQNTLVLREARTRLIHQIIHDITTPIAFKDILTAALSRLGIFLDGSCDITLATKDGSMSNFVVKNIIVENKDRELIVAKWSMENNKSAGLFTDTLSSAKALYVPIKGTNEKIGALAFKPNQEVALSTEDFQLLFTIAKLLGTFVERENYKKQASSAERLADHEKLHHKFIRMCLEDIDKTLMPIVNKPTDFSSSSFLKSWENLHFRLENLWLSSRLLVGIFPLNESICTPLDLLKKAQEKLKLTLTDHKISIHSSETISHIKVDASLIIHALANILLNCVQHSNNNDDEIKIEILNLKDELKICISDQGPGVPSEDLGRIFEKFYRSNNKNFEIKGLGLTVAKGIIRAHDGKIKASNQAQGGLLIEVTLPFTEH